jgi:hypothetical protein
MQAAVPLWKVSLAPPRRRTEPGPQGPGFLLAGFFLPDFLLLIAKVGRRLRARDKDAFIRRKQSSIKIVDGAYHWFFSRPFHLFRRWP